MKKADLYYSYPESLVATSPSSDHRILFGGKNPEEISRQKLYELFQPGDVLIINDTKVEKRRLFSKEGLEILFVKPALDLSTWEVLFPSRNITIGEEVLVIDDKKSPLKMTLLEKGLPQKVKLNRPLTSEDFEKWGEPALPPYIQKARENRHAQVEDESWYQTKWAKVPGSSAAPTASLHFSENDMEELRKKGVKVLTVTLHVGLGTFLPVKVEDLNEHTMHSESAVVPAAVAEEIELAKKNNKRVWALGTTSARAIESWALGLFKKNKDGDFSGNTDLFIQPGYEWQVVSGLLTNFHQPESTLLALVCGFSDLESVKKTYSYAIENKFRLFSYGDLSVWLRSG